mmetsp:Transcript_3938/g.3870  ORF Transcript_3938/g.3870 Transcript_3938/m.3870 type:complete len:86 (+) Transcript_3938:265-522(+)
MSPSGPYMDKSALTNGHSTSLNKQVTFNNVSQNGSYGSLINRHQGTGTVGITGNIIVNSGKTEKSFIDQARIYNQNRTDQLKVMQ